MRGKVHIEEMRGDREAIIVTEVPYQVNKATMIEKMAELVRDKRIEGISDIRDESDRQGYRVVIELKRDAVADVVLNQLYRFTPLQTSFGANMVALNGGKPEVMNLIRHAEGVRQPSARRWSAAARNSCCARRASARMCWSASPSPSPISTRSSADPHGARSGDGARAADDARWPAPTSSR
jgi:hypothetical protein